MTTEEKAKAYDEALERARDMLSYKEVRKEDMEYLFPELKKSEDERIRKALIELVKYAKEGGLQLLDKPFNDVPMDTMIAWLEKKKSHKWSDEDDIGLDDALWCCKQAASIAKDENDMGNAWYAEKWLKSFKQRMEE